MTVGLFSQDQGGGYLNQFLGYHQSTSAGNLSPAQFEYPASSAGAAAYTVRNIYVSQEGNPNAGGIEVQGFTFTVRGAVTAVVGDAAHVLPKDTEFTLHLAGSDWSRSYSLKNADERVFTASPVDRPYWQVGDVINEWFIWTSDFPPLVDGETVTVRLTHPPTTAPPPPANLTASPGDRRVTLAWDAPAAAAGISHHEFRYKWRTTGDYNPWKAIPDSAPGGGNASGYTTTGHSDYPATGYPNLIDHVFQVRAVNAVGESGPSNEAAVTPLHPKAPPAPTVRAPAGTAGLLEVSWTAVASASAYEVRYWPADEDGRSFRTRRTRDTSALIQPLAANTEYRVSVSAQGGPWSAVATARTGAEVRNRGKPVLSLHLLDSGGSEIGEGAITEGGRVRYRVKATNIRNYHDWGNPGVLGHFRLRADVAGDRHPPLPSGYVEAGRIACEMKPLMRVGLVDTQPSFTQTSATTGYWDFRTAVIPDYTAELGPLTLALQSQRCGNFALPGPYPQVGSPSSACVTIADNGKGDAYDYGSDDTMLTEKPTYSCSDRRSTRSLEGRFVSPPERHDGKKRVKVRVAFSEPVEESPEKVGEHGVEVEGGEVTSVSAVGGDAPDGAGTRKGSRSAGGRNAGEQDREVVWEFEIEPGSDGDVTISLVAGRPCDEPGAICTADGRALSEEISTTVEGPDTGPPPLTAAFEGMPEAHDGEGGFRFRVAFSEDIGISYRSLREDAFAVTGGRVTRGRRVDDRRDLFEMTVEPDGEGEVTVTLPAGRECGVSGAICTKGENRRQLTNAPTATVAGPAVETGAAGLTARFARVPPEHDGTTAFKLRIAFSETIRMSGRRLRSDVVAVAGGRATKAGRVNRRKDLWKLKVRPDSLADVTVTLAAGAACDTPEAVCTKGEPRRRLTNTISATVKGPVAVSVADARAREGEDETIDFAVTLSRAAPGAVSVTWATADGTATAGSDYTRASGKLRFAPGETEKTIPVPVLDDAHDEGEETFTLRLSAASGAVIADGEATGTIENSDPIPQAWLARFGRTVAGHVTDAIADRLTGPAGGGSHVTLGGRRLSLDGHAPNGPDATGPQAADGLTAFADRIAAHADGGARQRREPGAARSLTGRELLLGSSFRLAPGGGSAGSAGTGWTAWGRAARSRFDGDADGLALDGDVTTFTLGADAAWSRWLAGVALAHSTGEGGYRDHAARDGHPDRGSGTLESTLTSVHPYARYRAGERLTLWGMLGYGAGDLTLTMKGRDGAPDTRFDTDAGFRMAAAGARGVLVAAGDTGGFELAGRTDAQLVRTTSEKTDGLAATTADTSRLRLVLEGSRRMELAGGQTLAPTLEVGLRHDGGDAETGAGIEAGGGVRYADPALGLTAQAKARTLIAHEDSDYREWGASGSVRIDPGASGRGLSLTLAPAWGAASGGADRLWSLRDARAFAANDAFDPAGRLDAEAGYGLGAFGGRGLMTPYTGLALSETGARAWRTGVRWTLGPGVAFGVEGTRGEPANDDAPEHGLAFRATLRW